LIKSIIDISKYGMLVIRELLSIKNRNKEKFLFQFNLNLGII